jgi:surface antigen
VAPTAPPAKTIGGEIIMRKGSLPAIALTAVLLAGCGPDGPTNADTGLVVGDIAGGIIGNQVGKGSGNVLATVAGAMIGGIVGSEIGRRMDEHDRMLAQQAEYAALEEGESGHARRWRNPDNGRYGDVTPGRPYKRSGRDCRDYTHTVYIDGKPSTMRGTACRNPDGTWKNVA